MTEEKENTAGRRGERLDKDRSHSSRAIPKKVTPSKSGVSKAPPTKRVRHEQGVDSNVTAIFSKVNHWRCTRKRIYVREEEYKKLVQSKKWKDEANAEPDAEGWVRQTCLEVGVHRDGCRRRRDRVMVNTRGTVTVSLRRSLFYSPVPSALEGSQEEEKHRRTSRVGRLQWASGELKQ